ncbi:MAG: HepT-like ribonuclease domain-containing protein [Terriglobia bacterium]
MQPEAKDAAYLWDMLDAARAIQNFVLSRSFEDYKSDRMLRGAVERHIEIIGEAANKLSRGFRAAHSEIPWQRIIAQRNVLAHEYGEVDDSLVWRVATSRISELIGQIEPLVPPLP